MKRIILSVVAVATMGISASANDVGYVAVGGAKIDNKNSGFVEVGQIVKESKIGLVGIETKIDNKNIDLSMNKMFDDNFSYGAGKIWKKDKKDGFYGTVGRGEKFGDITGTISAKLGDGIKSVNVEAVTKTIDKQFTKVSVERDLKDYETTVKVGYGISF